MLAPNYNHEIPEMTAEVAKAAFPKGNVVMKIRDELGPLFEDDEFLSLYPQIGQPAASPARLALVTLLQFMENLTDREAADAVRSRIDWKYGLGLELTDPGFNYSILSEFRQRLLDHDKETVLLDTILTRCQEKNLLKGKSKQRTDSTHIVAAIRIMNRVELVGEAMRRVLDDIAQVAPEWLTSLIQPEWGKRYSRRVDTHHLSKTKRKTLAKEIGGDGHFLFKAIYQEDTPDEVKQLSSVEVLRRIWIQQYYANDDKIYWREKDQYGTPTSQTMIGSPDEIDARYGSKDSRTWTGYKVHLTETCDETAPRLITQVETTVATTPDASVLENIQNDLVSRNLTPESQWVDGGYPNVDVLLSSQDKGIDLIGPMRPDTSWQAKMEGGYDQTKFVIDWDDMIATCPAGETSIHWKEGKTATGRPNIHFAFSLPVCTACPSRHLCTKAKKIGRHITMQPQKAYEIQKAARERQASEGFKELYNRRAGIEGTIAQAVRGKNMRYARYRGLLKTHLQHLGTAAAINLQRIAAWLMGDLPKGTRMSPFAALVSPL